MGHATLAGQNDHANGITSTTYGAKVAQDVNIAGSSAGGSGIPVVVAEKTILSVTGSTSSNAQIIAAVTSKRIKVVACEAYTAYSTGTITPIFTDGNGGTTLWTRPMQAISSAIAGAVAATSAPSWLFGTTAGNPLYLNPNGQTVYYNISYFADDAS